MLCLPLVCSRTVEPVDELLYEQMQLLARSGPQVARCLNAVLR